MPWPENGIVMYVFISVYVSCCKLTILGLVSYRRGIADPLGLCTKEVPCNVHHQLLYEPLGGQKQYISWCVCWLPLYYHA